MPYTYFHSIRCSFVSSTNEVKFYIFQFYYITGSETNQTHKIAGLHHATFPCDLQPTL